MDNATLPAPLLSSVDMTIAMPAFSSALLSTLFVIEDCAGPRIHNILFRSNTSFLSLLVKVHIYPWRLYAPQVHVLSLAQSFPGVNLFVLK